MGRHRSRRSHSRPKQGGSGCILLFGLFFLLALFRTPSQPVQHSTRSVLQPTRNPEPTATPALQSGGLGLIETEWEAKYGEDTNRSAVSPTYEYEGKMLYVDYYNPPSLFPDGIVQRIERNYDEGDAVPLDNARAEAAHFFPSDAQLIKTYEQPARHDMRMVDLYMSPSLANHIPPTRYRFDDPWIGGEPGNFIAVYVRNDDGRIRWWYIETGSVP